MKITGIFLLLIFLLSGGNIIRQAGPAGLMIEFIRDPGTIPVADLKPEFSWVVPSKAITQTAYQILVASSRALLERDVADIRDSKKVISNNSACIELSGKPLEKKTSYFWKVRIWNEKDQPTEYSEIQGFKTGFSDSYLTTTNRFLSPLVAPVKFVKTAEADYFIDFGKDAFGTLVLNCNPVREDTIVIHLGESLSSPGRIDRKPGGTIRYQRVMLKLQPGKKNYTVELPADTRNTGPAAIHLPDSAGIITPFRYVELENCSYDLKPSEIRQKAYFYYFDDTMSFFTSSDTILNKVWDISKYSIKATTFAGIYVDGDRERIPYEADAYINQLGHYYTDREYSMARLTNEYFINHPTWPTEWILHTVPMFYNDFMYTGDLESAADNYEALKNKTLFSLSREDGLISSKNCTVEIMKALGFTNASERLRDIVDWPPAQKDTGWKLLTPEGERDGYDMVDINTVVNAFYYRSLMCMSDLSGALREYGDSVFYRQQASRVKKSINEKLLIKSSGIYSDGESSQHSSLHANMMALAFDLVPEEYKRPVIEFIKSRGMACSVYGAQYLLEGLFKAGESEYALSLLSATSDRSWWNMIRTGSTITMEAWDLKYKPNSDWNHAWGAAPANIIPHYLWGIGPAEPGYAKAIIKPQMGRLNHSKISVPTIRGNIYAEFSNTGSSKEYLITIPANMKCDFLLEYAGIVSVNLNKKEDKTGNRILKLTPGINKIVIKQQSEK